MVNTLTTCRSAGSVSTKSICDDEGVKLCTYNNGDCSGTGDCDDYTFKWGSTCSRVGSGHSCHITSDKFGAATIFKTTFTALALAVSAIGYM